MFKCMQLYIYLDINNPIINDLSCQGRSVLTKFRSQLGMLARLQEHEKYTAGL